MRNLAALAAVGIFLAGLYVTASAGADKVRADRFTAVTITPTR